MMTEASSPGAVGSPTPLRLFLLLQIVLMGGWAVVLSRFQEGNVYIVVGPFALALALVLMWLRRGRLRAWFRPSVKHVLLGIGVGVAMTALTYPAFELGQRIVPGLRGQVSLLYSGAAAAPIETALPWTLVILFAEEVLFRGTLPESLTRASRGAVSARVASVLAVLSYGVAQLGAGSLIVALMALVCGSVWMFLRYRTESLVAPLVAHAIWTPIVILLHPVIP